MTSEEILIALEEELKTAQEDKNRLFAPVFKSGVVHGLETAILRIAEIYKLDVKEK